MAALNVGPSRHSNTPTSHTANIPGSEPKIYSILAVQHAETGAGLLQDWHGRLRWIEVFKIFTDCLFSSRSIPTTKSPHVYELTCMSWVL